MSHPESTENVSRGAAGSSANLCRANNGPTLALAAPGSPVVDEAARTISGLAVPFGPVGQTSAGRLQFGQGSLAWSDVRRVKLLVEHDQGRPVGYAAELVERPDGLHATFHVPSTPAGDQALAEAKAGLRDAFSVGVQLDDATAEKLRRAGTSAVPGRGQLREISLVSVPAFDDARVGAVSAHAELVVSSWSDPTPTPEGSTVTEQTTTDPAQPQPTPAPTEPTEPTVPAQPVEANAAAAPLAVAGGAVVTGSPSTYTFSADGPSLVRDAWSARVEGNVDAAQRLQRYNAELTDGNLASVMALAAVMTTADPDAPVVSQPNVRRPDLLLQSIDRGRPLNGRIRAVPIRNATPLLIPQIVGFTGVADHTEGTAHVPEGTLDLAERTLAPKAVSGAFRMSRELVDSSNPAIDRIALAAMLRNYRKITEDRLATALLTGDAVGGITTVQGLRTELVAFGDDDTEADVIFTGRGFFQALVLDTDADGRPMLPFVGPANASGTTRAGYTGASVDGVEVAKSSALPTERAVILDTDKMLVVESQAQTFRFDEVEGPGIVKLALFGYYGAAVLDAAGVRELATSPEPVT